MKAYDVGSKLYKDGIAISALLIEALENLSVFPNTIAEIKRGYEESRKQQEEALKQAWSVVYQDGNNPGPYPFPADPSQETSETLIPPEVSGYEDIETFPAGQNLLNDSILSTPSSEFKNDLYGRMNGFPLLQRDMKDNILYSKGGFGTKELAKVNIKDFEIKNKHLSGSTAKRARQFNVSTPQEANKIVQDALKNGNVHEIVDNGVGTQGQKSFSAIINAGKTIGTKGETYIKIVYDELGNVWTTYPVPNP